VRYTPDGLIDRQISLPVSKRPALPSEAPNLIVCMTSALSGLTPEKRARERHAGSLFAFIPGVRGRREFCYAG
jgi:L-arabinonolactonase